MAHKTITISLKQRDIDLLNKVSEIDRRNKSNTLVISLENYAKSKGVDKR